MGLKRPLGSVNRTLSFGESSLQPQEAAVIEANQTAPLGGRGEGIKERERREEGENQWDPGGLVVVKGWGCR